MLEDADMKKAAKTAVSNMFMNSGQVCTAPTRILVPKSKKEAFESAVQEVLPSFSMGDPREDGHNAGPLVSEGQWETVQSYIQKGIDEAQPFSPEVPVNQMASLKAIMQNQPCSPMFPMTWSSLRKKFLDRSFR